MFLFTFFDFYLFIFIFSVTASLRCWATSVASSSSTRWSSVCGCWPSVLSSVSSWGATTSCQPCLTSSRSLSRRRSLESFWLPSGYVENLSLVQHFSKIPLFTKNVFNWQVNCSSFLSYGYAKGPARFVFFLMFYLYLLLTFYVYTWVDIYIRYILYCIFKCPNWRKEAISAIEQFRFSYPAG